MTSAPDPIRTVNVDSALGAMREHWKPRILAELNGQAVKAAKLLGEFVWHKHDLEDELFLVVRGHLVIELRTGAIELREGELAVIPRGVEHRPIAREEVEVLLFEPSTTLNTGDVRNERTVETLERV